MNTKDVVIEMIALRKEVRIAIRAYCAQHSLSAGSYPSTDERKEHPMWIEMIELEEALSESLSKIVRI